MITIKITENTMTAKDIPAIANHRFVHSDSSSVQLSLKSFKLRISCTTAPAKNAATPKNAAHEMAPLMVLTPQQGFMVY